MVALILHLRKTPDCIESLIYGNWLKPESFHGIGFSAYERLGNIQGSSLLRHPVPIRETCAILIEKAKAHNVCCLEVRCSPTKYASKGLSGERVAQIIAAELQASGIETTMILTASRHGSPEEMDRMISLAEALLENNAGVTVFRGFDLAGNEQARRPADVRTLLLPLMEHCLHVTIHAGEGTPADSIWEAVYHLNAERIGHGLTLKDRPELLKRFLDRNIAVEMCPSSNMQIVGFRDNFLPETIMNREYPLKYYLDAGIRVTVNTDNPGISRTDFTRELHRAARLTPGGLSLWDMLRIVRNGFKSAFVDRSIRNELLRKAESRIIDLILEEPWP
jgi:adenosine deaminase